MLTKEKKQEIALFRYRVIAPLITGKSNLSQNKHILELSKLKYQKTDGSSASISADTIERWYYNYKKLGFEGLIPRNRNDAGTIRKADDDIMNAINHYIQTYPRITAKSIYQSLIENGYITISDMSYSTISRYVSKIKKKEGVITTSELKRYEADHINDIWCCDTTYSFKIKDSGIKKRMYIIAIIDDASRLIVGINVFFNDNYINFSKVLKEAIKKYGKPKTLNLDNGGTYNNKQLDLLGARLGINLHHCAPYSGWQKGKIERWFRTMKDHFMAEYDLAGLKTIDQFRNDLFKYVVKYNSSYHKSINMSPLNRFFDSGEEILQVDKDKLDKSFLLEIDRVVSTDSVIVINGIEYEVPYKYSRQKITIRYSDDLNSVYVVNDDKLEPIKLLDKSANGKIKRKQPIYNVEELK